MIYYPQVIVDMIIKFNKEKTLKEIVFWDEMLSYYYSDGIPLIEKQTNFNAKVTELKGKTVLYLTEKKST
jgi:hypothetical protein